VAGVVGDLGCWEMNLGQILGEKNLRIMQLEDELAAAGSRQIVTGVASTTIEYPAAARTPEATKKLRLRMRDNGRCRTGMSELIRGVLCRAEGELTIAEIAARISGATSDQVAPLIYHVKNWTRSTERPYRYRWTGKT